MSDIKSLEKISTQVRRDILRMVHKVNSGHPGGSLGCVEFFVTLYFHVMETKVPFLMDGKEEDLFFLSNEKFRLKSKIDQSSSITSTLLASSTSLEIWSLTL